MKVLIPIDDSEHSNEAVDYVSRMPWPENTEFIVFSAAPYPLLVGAEIYANALYADDGAKRALEYHQKLAADARTKLRRTHEKTRSVAVNGDPRIGILDAVRDEKIDLVVMGSHGRTGLAKLVMGSVASYVATHAPCSVLIVKKPPGQRG